MFWNDIKQIKAEMKQIKHVQDLMNATLNQIFITRPIKSMGIVEGNERLDHIDHSLDVIRETLDLHFIKNVEELKIMVNEIKEGTAMFRAALQTPKKSKHKRAPKKKVSHPE